MKYYTNQTLLSKLDINNEKPEIFGCVGNRSAGKTFNFNRYLVNKFLKENQKFMLIYRYKYELSDIEDKFFNCIACEFPDYTMISKSLARGNFYELFLNNQSCGYAVAISGYAIVKKYSHYFTDVQRMLFDEFQNEDNRYIQNEVNKLINIHTSVSRGYNKTVRYVPLFLLSNTVSILNPYYTALGIAAKIQSKTKFLRGEGFVFEFCFNKNASEAQKDSAFNRAFKNNTEIEYMTDNIYLNDNYCLIDKSLNKSKYLFTLYSNGNEYGVYHTTDNLIYVDRSVDKSFIYKYAANLTDVNEHYIIASDMMIIMYRRFFKNSQVRFKDLDCKAAFIDFIKY